MVASGGPAERNVTNDFAVLYEKNPQTDDTDLDILPEPVSFSQC